MATLSHSRAVIRAAARVCVHISNRAQRCARNPELMQRRLNFAQRVLTPMYWRVALLTLLTASMPQAKAEPPDEQALRLLNHVNQRLISLQRAATDADDKLKRLYRFRPSRRVVPTEKS